MYEHSGISTHLPVPGREPAVPCIRVPASRWMIGHVRHMPVPCNYPQSPDLSYNRFMNRDGVRAMISYRNE